MLNIISRSIISKTTRGPHKVVSNLIQGLKEIKYPFVVNADLKATKTIWIHDDPKALEKAMELPPDVAIVAGPNVFTLPSDIPETIDMSRVIWIHPAPWVQSFWQTFSTRSIPSTVWPTGIDTINFRPEESEKKEFILIYNKQRSNTDTETVCEILKAKKEKYKIITYGKYQEVEYKNLLKKAKAIIWIGRSESQGIGLLEALATNIPALIWDVRVFGHWTGSGHERFTKEQLAFTPVTAAPYFDNRCGVLFIGETNLDTTLSQFLDSLSNFRPREYIQENLSLAKQANDFIDIYKKYFKQDDTILKNTALTTKKVWRNNTYLFRLLTTSKDAIRRIMG